MAIGKMVQLLRWIWVEKDCSLHLAKIIRKKEGSAFGLRGDRLSCKVQSARGRKRVFLVEFTFQFTILIV